MNASSKSIDTNDNKYWIQMLVNVDDGKALTKAIMNKDPQLEEITWLSPLKELQYVQYRLYQEQIYEKLNLKKEDIDTLPINQPLWDAVGVSGETIILVEGDNSYYMAGSSLTFINKLRSKGYRARLVLLNIVRRPDLLSSNDNTSYDKLFYDMYGVMETPRDVILLDYYIII